MYVEGSGTAADVNTTYRVAGSIFPLLVRPPLQEGNAGNVSTRKMRKGQSELNF
jgi:hypothetical protein